MNDNTSTPVNSEPSSDNTYDSPTLETNQDAKNLAMLIWLGTIVFGFIPGLLGYLLQKETAYVQQQSKEALNWSITVFIANIGAFILSFIGIGVLLFPIIGLCHLIFCAMGAIATYEGKSFSTPFSFRLIK